MRACSARQIAQVVVLWPESAACHAVLPPRPAPRGFTATPPQLDCPAQPPPGGSNAVSKERGLTEKHEAAVGLLEEPAEARFMEVDELRALAVEGRERGYLT